MPQIIVRTGQPGSGTGAEVLRESANPVDTETGRSRELLIDRIAWALEDAERIESRGERRYEEPPAETHFSQRHGSIADAALL